MSIDLLVRDVRPWGEEAPRDLAVAAGRFVEAPPGARAARTVDAGGGLGLPGFVEPHIHLDKVLINEDVRVNRSGTLDEAIEIVWERKRRYTVADIAGRAGRVIEQAVMNGVTHIRTHVDVDTIGGLRPLEGVVEARTRYRDIVDIEIVAFPQEGILRDAGVETLMRRAMAAGADVVGGMPFNEDSPADSRRHVAIAFDIARSFDADIDMHVDETDDPAARTLEMVAEQTLEHGYQGRVTAGHTCALAAYPDDYARHVIDLVRRAGINVIVNPATNLMLQGRLDAEPRRRGITRVKELLAAGVNLACGQDCVRDTFYPFGRADPLEVAALAAHAAHMSQPEEIETVLAMTTRNAARALRLDGYGLAPGCRADLVVVDARDAADAIARCADRRCVVKRGRVVAESATRRTAHWRIGADAPAPRGERAEP